MKYILVSILTLATAYAAKTQHIGDIGGVTNVHALIGNYDGWKDVVCARATVHAKGFTVTEAQLKVATGAVEDVGQGGRYTGKAGYEDANIFVDYNIIGTDAERLAGTATFKYLGSYLIKGDYDPDKPRIACA